MRASSWWCGLFLCSLLATAQAAPLSPGAAKSVCEILEVGFESGRESLPKAKALYEAAVKGDESSAELAYAYGLVLLKHFKSKEATAQFRLAAEHPGGPFWPAWQALIYSHFAAKETTAGYERLFDFAKRLQSASPEVPLDDQKRLVRWIGQLVGALDALAESPKVQETVRKQEVRLLELIAEPLQASFDEGRHEAADVALLMEVELDEARRQQQEKNERDRAERQSKVESGTEAAKKKAELVKKSATDWQRWLDDQLKQNDRLLARLEKEYGLLERLAQEILETQDQIDVQLNLLRLGGTGTPPPNIRRSSRIPFGQIEQQFDRLRNQKIQLQLELDRISQESRVISQNAAVVLNQRQAAIQQYQLKTGQLVKEEAALQKWQDRLAKDSAKLKSPASDKGGTVTRTLTKAKSLRTYLDFDLDDERRRLLEQLSSPEPNDKPNDN